MADPPGLALLLLIYSKDILGLLGAILTSVPFFKEWRLKANRYGPKCFKSNFAFCARSLSLLNAFLLSLLHDALKRSIYICEIVEGEIVGYR
jgi:hypothetical protein